MTGTGPLRSFGVKVGSLQVVFGLETIGCLEPWLEKHKKVAVITGRRSAEKSGALKDLLELLDKKSVSYEIYREVVPNPTDSIVDGAAEFIWRGGAQAVIAVGGGSVIDTAKLASAIAVCGGRARDYLKGARTVCGSLPVAVINLTHGTGSEADRYAVATVEETSEKVGVASDHLYPQVSIDDPRYTTSLPRNHTIYTSLDALYHSIEASTSILTSPYTLMLGEEAVRLIAQWLPRAVESPESIEARYWLLYASLLAGIAIDNSRTHLVHSMEHALSGLNPKLAHGAGLAMLGPAIIELVYKAAPEEAYRLLRHIDGSLKPSREDASRARKALESFQKRVGFSETLRDYGFTREHLADIKRLVFGTLEQVARLAPFEVKPETVERIYLELVEE